MKRQYLLGEVARVLGRKPHQIVQLLTTGKVSEPEQRIANKRLFSADDVLRLARHFRVAPDWSAVETPHGGTRGGETPGLVLKPPFMVEPTGQTCHEIRDGDGDVFGWAADRARALVIAGLLESAVAAPTRACHPSTPPGGRLV